MAGIRIIAGTINWEVANLLITSREWL